MTGRLRELAAKTFRPAYSGAFADHHLVRCPPLDPVELLTPEWAWGGSEGEGVKVAVVDSGVDASHPDVGTVDGYVAITEGDDLRFVYDTAPHDDAFGHGTPAPGSSAHWRHAASCTA
ncbi:S8 family serine peptidase [Mycobacterium rufum]|uniref:S8 family serine peptidase n=1 Tax=Mycolicibacterium rufum TaxID=318424 RepID=A0A9X2YBL1_9MYCO|nr:S8 family serine peptidase [Mycolicibacterium rufum]